MNARTWSRTFVRLGDPDPFMASRLEQADAWVDDTGEWRIIRDQPSAHLWAMLTYLRCNAPTLMAQRGRGTTAEAEAWLAQRPLVRAIDEELARRAEIEPGEAIGTVRAIGLAPWERGA